VKAAAIRHGGDVEQTPLGAQWTPIRHVACGTVLRFQQRRGEESSALYCATCRRDVEKHETDARGAVVVVMPGDFARAEA